MADTANTGIKEVDDVAPIKKGDGEKLAKEQIARFEELQSKRKAERDDDSPATSMSSVGSWRRSKEV